jgi:hypothetical protein
MKGYCLFHVYEQLAKRFGPWLVQFLVNKSQFAKDMAVAQAMIAGKFEIRCPAVMNEDAPVKEQDAEGSNGFLSPLGMNAVPRDQFCTEDVKPVELIANARP